MSLTPAALAAHFRRRDKATTRRTLPVLTADVPVGRPGWSLSGERCTHEESNGRAFRRCTRDADHGGDHFFGSWCLR